MSDRDLLLYAKEASAKELVRGIRELTDKMKYDNFQHEDPEGWAAALSKIAELEEELKSVRQDIRHLSGLEELLDKSEERARELDQADRERRLFATEERRLYELDHYLDKRGWGKMYADGKGLFMVYDSTSWANRPVSLITFIMKEGTNSSFVYARVDTAEKESETCCKILQKFPFVSLVCAYRFSCERKLSSLTRYALNHSNEPQEIPQEVMDTEMREFLPRTVLSSADYESMEEEDEEKKDEEEGGEEEVEEDNNS